MDRPPVSPRGEQPHPATPVVSVVDVHKSYRRGSEAVLALQGVNLEVQGGEVGVLIGPSGSGKTTLLNVIAGWDRPDRGEVLWRGRTGVALASLPWRDVAIVPQGIGLLEELSVRENVALAPRMRGGTWDRQLGSSDEEAMGLLLRELGLETLADREPLEISLGEQQRTSLARALVLSPRLVLADEPTGHQDAGWAKTVLQMFRQAADRGASCLVASHNDEAIRIADRVFAIRDGLVEELPLSLGSATDLQETRS